MEKHLLIAPSPPPPLPHTHNNAFTSLSLKKVELNRGVVKSMRKASFQEIPFSCHTLDFLHAYTIGLRTIEHDWQRSQFLD